MNYTFKAALLAAILTGTVQADVGGKEKGTYYNPDSETTTYTEINGVYYQNMHRSRFDRNDPNYYWLFDKAPCLYTEIWTKEYPCPVQGGQQGLPPLGEKNGSIPEPYPILLLAVGGVIFKLVRGRQL